MSDIWFRYVGMLHQFLLASIMSLGKIRAFKVTLPLEIMTILMRIRIEPSYRISLKRAG
jgi:hypothetical protein